MPTAKGGYKLADGTKVDSVTTILESLGWGKEGLMWWAWDLGKRGFDYKNQRDQAADRGTVVHDRIHSFLIGKEWDSRGFDPEHIVDSQGPFGKFLEWLDDFEIKILLAEEGLVSERLLLGGTPDFLCLIRFKNPPPGFPSGWILVLVDLKTSKDVYEGHVAQCAAYCELIEDVRPDLVEPHGEFIRYAVVLQIGRDGSFNPVWLNSDALALGWTAFEGAWQAHRVKKAIYAHIHPPKPRKKRAKKGAA